MRWVSVELSVAMDLYSRCIDAPAAAARSRRRRSMPRCCSTRPSAPDSKAHTCRRAPALHGSAVGRAGRCRHGHRPTAGLPGRGPGDAGGRPRQDLRVRAPARASAPGSASRIQPARPYTPTDKARRGAVLPHPPRGPARRAARLQGPRRPQPGRGRRGRRRYFFVDELEQIIREWVADRLPPPAPRRPGRTRSGPASCSPVDMFEHGHGPGRAACGSRPAPTWSTTSYRSSGGRSSTTGSRSDGLRYNGDGLEPLPQPPQPLRRRPERQVAVPLRPRRRLPGLLPGPRGPGLAHPALGARRRLRVPFSDEALAYARRLRRQTDRFPDDRRVLAELLERWDAG